MVTPVATAPQIKSGASHRLVSKTVVPFHIGPDNATGPAYEAIQHVGEPAFLEAAVQAARGHQRDGLPLRAELNVVGYVARKPENRS